MINKPKIAFVYYGNSTFVEQDYALLSKHFVVTKVEYRGISDVFKILTAVLKSRISFSWFADGWAFFAVLFSKLFRKKSVVVVGGYEVACVPEINYGVCTLSKARQWMIKFALNNADELLAVSNFTKTECLKYLTHPRDLSVLYNGIDAEAFKTNTKKKANLVLTVASGGGSSGSVIKLKGLDTFVKCANYLPGTKFVVVGLSEKDLDILKLEKTTNHLTNLTLVTHIPQQELIDYYQKAKVYCQLSYRESFGMALVEAMACGCIPVATDRGALPETVGNEGFYAPYGDVGATVEAIQEAFKSTLNPRKKVVNAFSLEKRGREILEVLSASKK